MPHIRLDDNEIELSILVNGVALGAETAPLLHGDRIEVAGCQLRFSDDHTAGSTVLARPAGAPDPSAVPTVGEVVSGEAPALATLDAVNEGERGDRVIEFVCLWMPPQPCALAA